MRDVGERQSNYQQLGNMRGMQQRLAPRYGCLIAAVETILLTMGKVALDPKRELPECASGWLASFQPF
jgi:hypothetical protein